MVTDANVENFTTMKESDTLRGSFVPANILGVASSETFHVPQNNEMRQYNEYRTQRLAVTTWKQLKSGDFH